MTNFCPHDRKSFPRKYESSRGLLSPPRVNQPFVFKQGGGMKPGQVSATRWCSQIRMYVSAKICTLQWDGGKFPIESACLLVVRQPCGLQCPLYFLFNHRSVCVWLYLSDDVENLLKNLLNLLYHDGKKNNHTTPVKLFWPVWQTNFMFLC